MAAISNGTTCLYGVAGTVNNLFVQSYSISSSFNAEATVVNESGITVTHRMDDRKTEITVDGIAKSSSIPSLGANLTFTANTSSAYTAGTATSSFSGVITKVAEKGTSQGFTSVSVTAIDYEGITM